MTANTTHMSASGQRAGNRSSPHPVAGGGFVLIFSDITDRKRNETEIRAARDAAEEASRTIETVFRDLKAAQANLIQAEKMAFQGQLTAGIAHEIKDMMGVFLNLFEAMAAQSPLVGDHTEFVVTLPRKMFATDGG